MRSKFLSAFIASTALFAATPAFAATTIDFSTLPAGSTTGASGVTFSLEGGADGGDPAIGNAFGDSVQSLTNSTGVAYPTAFSLVSTFAGLASGVSFTFNNYGSFNGSNYVALDGMGNTVSSGLIDSFSSGFALVNVGGSGIKTLKINNNSDTQWLFGVGQLSFTAAGVPEPATWAFMILGFGLVGGAMRRRATVVSTKVSYA